VIFRIGGRNRWPTTSATLRWRWCGRRSLSATAALRRRLWLGLPLRFDRA